MKIEREWRERLRRPASVTGRPSPSPQAGQPSSSSRCPATRQPEAGQREAEGARQGWGADIEEMGQQLSWSKLQLSSMKDDANVVTEWKEDSAATNCPLCGKFSLARRKHHCRNCGGILCQVS